jgi:hypothetical protein
VGNSFQAGAWQTRTSRDVHCVESNTDKMAEAAFATGTDGPEGETPGQRQARLRREKLKKKMADQGEDRLAKIKALNGGVAPPTEVLGGRK